MNREIRFPLRLPRFLSPRISPFNGISSRLTVARSRNERGNETAIRPSSQSRRSISDNEIQFPSLNANENQLVKIGRIICKQIIFFLHRKNYLNKFLHKIFIPIYNNLNIYIYTLFNLIFLPYFKNLFSRVYMYVEWIYMYI